MKSNWLGRTPTSLVWPATALVAIGVWLWREQGPGPAVLVGAATLILVALVRFIWLSRVRAARRFRSGCWATPPTSCRNWFAGAPARTW